MKILESANETVQQEKKQKKQSNMKSELEKLMQQKKALQTQLVQVQTMLYLIDYYISEELLKDIDC